MKQKFKLPKLVMRAGLAWVVSAGLLCLWTDRARCWLASVTWPLTVPMAWRCWRRPPHRDAEHAADLASACAVFKNRTPAEEARAKKDANLSLFNFAPAIGDCFQEGRFPKLEAFFQNVKTNISDTINVPKNHWKRARPYELDRELTLGQAEKSFSYPSGHSTRGTVVSLLLAELFQEKRDAILTFGRQIGWDRVILGKHFPTDVQAGRVLGQAIVRELMASPAFQRDLAEVKAEVRAAKPASGVGN